MRCLRSHAGVVTHRHSGAVPIGTSDLPSVTRVEAILRARFFGRDDLSDEELAYVDASTPADQDAAEAACRSMPNSAMQLTWLSELYALRDRYRPEDTTMPNHLVIAGMASMDRARYLCLWALVFGPSEN